MDIDDIKTYFLAAASLRHCPLCSSERSALEDTVVKLEQQYFDECMPSEVILPKAPQKMTAQEAINVLVQACESATSLELEHKPNGLDEKMMQSLVMARKMALEIVVDILAKDTAKS